MKALPNRDFTFLNLSMPMDVMRFFLVYRGDLKSTQRRGGDRREDRIAIRKQIVPQMQELWNTSVSLKNLTHDAIVSNVDVGSHFSMGKSPFQEWRNEARQIDAPLQTGFVDLSEVVTRNGKQFRPLVRRSLDLTCSMNVLFLRGGDPGRVRNHEGDIDNRLKTFIDALGMPEEGSTLEGDEHEGINLPVYESDALVRGLEISTERLLLPDTEQKHEVHIIAEIVVHVERVGPWNIALL